MGNHDITPPRLVEWGVAARPLPGQVESGDLHLVKPFANGVLVAAVDGLGHGHEAAEAARIAVATLEAHAGETIISLVTRCHERLRGTRGVVMTLAWFSARDGTMAWLSVGNVEGVLLRVMAKAHRPREYVVLRGGVVGEQLPPLQPSVLSVGSGDTLILATDGIGHGFVEGLNLNDPPQEVADQILITHGKSTDDALVLVARWVGTAP